MIALGLSAQDQRRFEQGLVSSHSIRITVKLLDLDHNLISEVRGRVLSGQVDVDAFGEVSRTASLDVRDADHALNLDTGATLAGGLFLDRMVQINYGVWSQQLPRWVDVPIFTGPIRTVTRDGDVVSLTAESKESLLMGPYGRTATWPKGVRKTDLVKAILQTGGEMFHDIPRWPAKTTKAISLGPESDLWKVARSVGRSWGEGHLYYEGRGYVKLFASDRSTRWTFRAGRGGSLVGIPKIAYDVANVRNHVVVTGATPAGRKDPVKAHIAAPANSPLSPQSLARGGVPRHIFELITDDTITTQKAAIDIAKARLADYMAVGIQLDFDALVIPHLEPLDRVVVETDEWSQPMAMSKFTIPLSGGDHMSVGRNISTKTVRRARPTARKGPRFTKKSPIAVQRAAKAKAK